MTDNRIYHPRQPVFPVSRPGNAGVVNGLQRSAAETAFSKVLEQELAGLKFSQHALQRLASRNIQLSQSEMAKLNSAVEKAAQKGSRESLILMNNELALVVSIKNKTVITAVDGASMKDNVFTNIDSAVIV